MTVPDLRAEVESTFDLQDDSAAVTECMDIIHAYSLDLEKLRNKWEAFVLNGMQGENISKPTVDLLKHFRANLQSEAQDSLRNATKLNTPSRLALRTPNKGNKRTPNQIYNANSLGGYMDTLSPDTPSRKRPSSAFATPESKRRSSGADWNSSPSSSSPSASRSNSSKAKLTLNSHISLRSPLSSANEAQVRLELAQQPTGRFKYMFEKLTEKSEGLDDRIEYFADIISRFHEVEQLSNPSHPSQEPVTYVGRICNEDAEGRLKDNSVVLESSRRMGAGRRVKVDLSAVGEYSLFPGQVVGVEGTNPTGDLFHVTKILYPPLPPVSVHDPDELEGYNLSGQPVTIFVAAGPYTSTTDSKEPTLDFEPFRRLVDIIIDEAPDVVILLGPFIDQSHPCFQVDESDPERGVKRMATIDSSLEDIFRRNISQNLDRIRGRHPKIEVILIPHTRDVFQTYAVLPQPAFDQALRESLGLDRSIKCLSNPSMFTLNEVCVGVCTADTLFGLSREGVPSVMPDRMGRFCKHLLQQRSFYPLFPPAEGDNLNFEHLPQMQMDITPDVLIVPSQLTPFAKVVDNVVCINPEAGANGQAKGGYAKLTIAPLSRQEDGTFGKDARVYERLRVDFV
ncbi:hypothetical protein BZG36_03826 [Bifiguratus adelaidae]|uniref:DNA polymerase alpha subunit B n=1 Tax=Bifiguratus adelaidae TaxID=1938954 RepID=A0A261XZR4_9FUNG|nr:hypothetical protein BZG36_03826 [Bifiguratus adelaidae]